MTDTVPEKVLQKIIPFIAVRRMGNAEGELPNATVEIKLLFCLVYRPTSNPFAFCIQLHWLWGRGDSLPVTIQGNSYSFDISESEYDNQIALVTHQCKPLGY